jgi:hypothetical protein
MSGSSRGVIWFNRLLLLAATFIMGMISLRTLRDPVASTQPMGIVVTSATAATVVRVGFGGFPLGFAIALFGCLLSTRRLLGGLYLLASIAGAATLTRLQGILLDAATPYNLLLLRPEIALCVLSAVAIVLERRRRRAEFHAPSTESRGAPGNGPMALRPLLSALLAVAAASIVYTSSAAANVVACQLAGESCETTTSNARNCTNPTRSGSGEWCGPRRRTSRPVLSCSETSPSTPRRATSRALSWCQRPACRHPAISCAWARRTWPSSETAATRGPAAHIRGPER